MSEQNVAVEEVKKKRTRVKPKKTGLEIVAEIEQLKLDVAQLEAALTNVEAGTIIHELATKELTNKKQVLEDSLNTFYHFA